MKFAVGFQLYREGEEPFSRIVETYREHISEVFFSWMDTPSGRSVVATMRGFTDWTAQSRMEQELRAIKDNYPKTVLTLDRFTTGNYDGIEVLYLPDWLMT